MSCAGSSDCTKKKARDNDHVGARVVCAATQAKDPQDEPRHRNHEGEGMQVGCGHLGEFQLEYERDADDLKHDEQPENRSAVRLRQPSTLRFQRKYKL